MANLHATTVTNTAAQITDREAVEALFEEYTLCNLDFDFGENDELLIHGYDTFAVYQLDEHGDIHGHPVNEEFLYRLSQYIAEEEKLDLRTVGHTKLRHVTATRRVVSPGRVEVGTLESDLFVVNPPAELAEVMDDVGLEKIDASVAPDAPQSDSKHSAES